VNVACVGVSFSAGQVAPERTVIASDLVGFALSIHRTNYRKTRFACLGFSKIDAMKRII
jgi:hypothetical protein